MHFFSLKIWCWWLLLLPFWVQANPVDGEHIQVGLHSEVQSVQPGVPFWVALRLTPEAHWHTYWKNPGDSGAPPKVVWALPSGVQAGKIQWPAPQRIPVAHLVNLGYEGEVWLPVQITPPAQLEINNFSMTAALNWLVCKEECIPGEATLHLKLPVTAQPPIIDPRWQQQFADTRASLPELLDAPAQLVQKESAFQINIEIPENLLLQEDSPVGFWPQANDLIEHAAAQPWTRQGSRLSIELPQSPYFTVLADEYAGVLQLNGKSYQLTATTAAVKENTARPEPSDAPGLLLVGLFALAGGMLLNLMPCVLPVLSLKALSLVQHGQAQQVQRRLQGLMYTLGVIGSFLLVATVLLVLRAGGEQIGWGFQLQNPIFITLLIYLLFVLGFGLSGIVNIGQSWMGAGQSLSQRSGYSGAFFTGVLAVLVASPCTAPFMGTALGYAVTQSTALALSVFVLLGLGMALPFLLLSFSPGLLRFLPKPGVWMETFKQLLAFPLYATALWLLWVLGRQVGVNGMTAALVGVLLLALGLWLLSGGQQLWRKLVFVVTLLATLGIFSLPVFTPAETITNHKTTRAYTPEKLSSLRAEKKPVFVNLTADWCITCLVNEQVALGQPEVQQAFAERDIVYMKGDWTNRDKNITRLLSEHGRNGVPLYLFYAAGAAQAKVLPQILTPGIVINALDTN